MRINSKKLLIGVVILVVIIVAVIMYFSQKNLSFQNVVSKQISISEINEIKITRISSDTLVREEVTINEEGDIRNIMKNLNTIKLLKKHNQYIPNTDYRYDLIIQVNQEDRFGITFLNESNLELYDARNTSNRITRYEIINGYDVTELAGHFAE
ncbi:hypothetical protein [Paenibacillus lautus]|uniref:hypothetical protein n=1 Tax=Paenibacillus lautus TaxID=1401 RepID=UPI001C7D81FD|nr:hypothetical protein [Paenibacillus lautus]MBX4147716.1 hypothetical protein [Paenibacillus lautus]